jgi:hypothetical protein
MQTDSRLLALFSVACLGCSATDVEPHDFGLAPGAPPPILTDATRYTLAKVDGGYDAQAHAVYTNATGRTVYYRRCGGDYSGPIYDVRRTGPDSAAQSFVGAVWACVGGVPTGRVPPGGTLSADVWLGSTDSPHARPPIAADERVGQFRIVFALCTAYARDSDDCDPLPAAARESNAFEVTFGTP